MILRAAAAIALICWAAPISAQLRIVDYNIAENYDIAGDPGGLDTIFAAIGAKNTIGFAKPIDILAVQEASPGDPTLLAGILNDVFDVSTYVAAPYVGNSIGNGLPALVYNSATVGIVPKPVVGTPDVTAFGSIGSGTNQQPRSTLRYHMRPVGYDAAADFYIYNSHYKSDTGADDQAQRFAEAQSIRNNADALGEGTHVLYVGDFNTYNGSTEAMYAELLSAGPGQAFDPVSLPGNWASESAANILKFKHIHTQSPATVEAFGGQVLGGMDNRFDFQLVTGEWLDQEGLGYLSIDPTPGTPNDPSHVDNIHSYHTFGNNNTHAHNGAITTGTGAAANVLTALAQSSDHLPVVADYQLPAKLGVAVASTPMTVNQGASFALDLTITNLAPALAALAADELDYTISVIGGWGTVIGAATGIDAATGGGVLRQVSLNTATPGEQSGLLRVTTNSQGAADALFEQLISFEVIGAFLEADFNEDGSVDGDDLADWEANFGDTGGVKADGDANLDGLVDGSDFLMWQRQVGLPPAAIIAGEPVPEPTTALLLLFGAAVFAARRRGQRAI